MRDFFYYLFRFCKSKLLSIVLYGLTADSYLNSIFPFFNVPNQLTDERKLFLREWLVSSNFRELKLKLEKDFDGNNKTHRELVIKLFVKFINTKKDNERWPLVLQRINQGVLTSHLNSNFVSTYIKVIRKIIRKFSLVRGTSIYMVSFGSASGYHEEIAHKKLKPWLKKNKLNLVWVGLDIYELNNNFFHREGNKFVKINSVMPGDRWQYFYHSKDKNQIIILHFLMALHHMEFSVKDLTRFSENARSTIIYEEPISKKHQKNFWIYSLRLAYDLIANVSFGTKWSKDLLEDHKNFKAKYLVLEDLEDKFDISPIFKRSPFSVICVRKR